MLLFELFPAVLAVVAVAVGIGLYLMDRRARLLGIDDSGPTGSRPSAPAEDEKAPTANRPSMRG